jgi:uncharacterized protein YbaR (Trm112 family)
VTTLDRCGVPEEVRALLVCPECRAPFEDLVKALGCRACGRSYPVVDGVPYLIVEESREWSPEEPTPPQA